MIPTEIIDFIPAYFNRDAKLTAFANKVDSILAYLKSDTLGLNTLIDPMRIHSGLLENLGFFLNAGLNPEDSEAEKRYKIAKAVETHKKRGSFNDDAKLKIDLIAGGNSSIIRSFDKDDWILVGDGNESSAYYWAVMGCDGIDGQGISLIGAGNEIEVAGNIYIDVDNAALGAADQESIRLAMLDIVPAYFAVHFGYVNVGGQFIEYFVME
jgi:phage tail-like protein